jgi:hypothetical protein
MTSTHCIHLYGKEEEEQEEEQEEEEQEIFVV